MNFICQIHCSLKFIIFSSHTTCPQVKRQWFTIEIHRKKAEKKFWLSDRIEADSERLWQLTVISGAGNKKPTKQIIPGDLWWKLNTLEELEILCYNSIFHSPPSSHRANGKIPTITLHFHCFLLPALLSFRVHTRFYRMSGFMRSTLSCSAILSGCKETAVERRFQEASRMRAPEQSPSNDIRTAIIDNWNQK